MPLYEYQCQACGERVEVIQKFDDPPYAHCPKCGGDMKKLQSAPAIQFKGSGWYVTDYASKESKATKGEKTESESSTEAKPEKAENKTKESSPAKKTSDKASPKASTD